MHRIVPFSVEASRRKSFARAAGVFLVVVAMTLVLPTAASAAGKRIAIWHMEDLGGDGHTMRDASPSDPSNDGTTTDVRVVNGWDGRGYKFNGTTSRVVVPDHASLDPGTQPIQITTHAKFRFQPAVSSVYVLLAKGGSKTSYYKMLINTKGKAVCAFKGSHRGASVHDAKVLAGHQRHTIVCAKRTRSISITVDGVTTSTLVRAGAISNARRLFLGAGAGGGSAFRGGLDETDIRVG